MRVKAEILNRPMAWVGPMSTWGGAPHCIKLFHALVETVPTSHGQLAGVLIPRFSFHEHCTTPAFCTPSELSAPFNKLRAIRLFEHLATPLPADTHDKCTYHCCR
jgi:hypothetical protein